MSINVSLETISLPELLKSIDLGLKSGRLTIEPWSSETERDREKITYSIWFEKGKFIAIEDNFKKLETIEIIKTRGWVGKIIGEKLERLCPTGEALGIYLTKMKLLTKEQLDFIFQHQLDRVYRLFEISSGRLIFAEISELMEADDRITMPWLEMTGNSLKASQIILNGIRLLRNWDSYEKRLPNAEFTIQQIISETELELLPLESQLLMKANGRNSLKTIAEKLDRPLEQIQKIAFSLITAGLIKEAPATNLWQKIATSSSLQNLVTNSYGENALKTPAEKLPSLKILKPTIFRKLAKSAIVVAGATGLTLACNASGIFQLLELSTLDRFFRWRPPEAADSNIIVVTIDDTDINKLGQWPMSDAKLTQTLKNLQKYKPSAIGLDLYRDIPVQPGHQQLLKVYQNMPNLVGIEKAVGQKVAPPPVLSELGQVAITDTLVDLDGRVRRSLISLESDAGELKLSLGVQLALIYLESKGISLATSVDNSNRYQLGKASFESLNENAGGYIRNNAGGYQIMLNYPYLPNNFQTISLTDVLTNRISEKLIRDRIVLIGASADSLKDFFLTPHSYDNAGTAVGSPGVFIHANIASQIIKAAVDGRPLLKVWSESREWLWILGWSAIGTALGFIVLKFSLGKKKQWINWLLYLTASGALFAIAYGIFLAGWWIPAIAPWIALSASILFIASDRQQKLQEQAYIDSPTQLVNRRYFNYYLEREWVRENYKYVALIFCELDKHQINDKQTKVSRDNYLRRIAKAISSVVGDKNLVARYGEDKFAVILPRTDEKEAIEISKKIQMQVQALDISLHRNINNESLFLSCGVVSTIASPESSPTELIAMADEALDRESRIGSRESGVGRRGEN
jgi:adenylate cyclase